MKHGRLSVYGAELYIINSPLYVKQTTYLTFNLNSFGRVCPWVFHLTVSDFRFLGFRGFGTRSQLIIPKFLHPYFNYIFKLCTSSVRRSATTQKLKCSKKLKEEEKDEKMGGRGREGNRFPTRRKVASEDILNLSPSALQLPQSLLQRSSW